MTNFEKVLEFHQVFEAKIGETPHIPDDKLNLLRVGLIEEELDELKEAISNNDLVELADALGDILYVTYGFAVTAGIPIDEIFAEIHKSNMSKLDVNGRPLKRDDGKILKGPNFKPPDIKGLLQ